MHKQAKIIFAFMLILTNDCMGQTYPLPTPGAQWNVLIDDPNCNCFCTAIYKYEKDTFLCGNTYAKISLQNSAQCTWWNPIYLRSSGYSVWGRIYDCNGPEDILYNFSLAMGDTFTTYYFDTTVVTNVGYQTMLNGQVRKKIIFKSINTFTGWQYEWIEGIGDLTMFYYLPILPDPVRGLFYVLPTLQD